MIKEDLKSNPEELKGLREELNPMDDMPETETEKKPSNPIGTLILLLLIATGIWISIQLYPVIRFLWQFVSSL